MTMPIFVPWYLPSYGIGETAVRGGGAWDGMVVVAHLQEQCRTDRHNLHRQAELGFCGDLRS